MQRTTLLFALFFGLLPMLHGTAQAEDRTLHRFERIELTDVYYSEGVHFGDVDGDGKADAVYGPYWFAGPDFKKKHEIYEARAQNRKGYANSFFSWLYDFNGDGYLDVFSVGFPGTPAYVYENPKKGGYGKVWKKHQVFDWVSNESPHFTNIVGDEKPELVCSRAGYLGYATIDWKKPLDAWTFHKISGKVVTERFGHGLGVGDVNGDGRLDMIVVDGWYEQPEKLDDRAPWKHHKAKFGRYGGAEMYAYDVDGDGDNDIITSLAAHDFGLAWFENRRDEEGNIRFREHLIMGSKPEENRYGLVFSELHTVALADIDGDGLKDIVTGKTYWSHHEKSPMWDAGAVVYWFRLVRDGKKVDWIPYKANGDTGVGRQVIVGDVDGDGTPDIVTGGMVGASVLLHRRDTVDLATWKAAQPKVFVGKKATKPDAGGETKK